MNELTERADNAIKFLSDMFSARLYKLAASKVGVPDYKDLVTEKLQTAEDLYRFMVDQFNQSRAFVLELMVVVILIIELVYFFRGKPDLVFLVTLHSLSSRAKQVGERSEPACAVEGPWVNSTPSPHARTLVIPTPDRREEGGICSPPPHHKTLWHSLPNRCTKDPDYEGVMAQPRHGPLFSFPLICFQA